MTEVQCQCRTRSHTTGHSDVSREIKMFSILHVILKNRPRMSAEKAMRNKQMKMPDAKLQFSP